MAAASLAHFRIGQSVQARELLQKAREAVSQHLPSSGWERSRDAIPWFDFIELLLLTEESAEFMGGGPVLTPIQVQQLRKQGLESLQLSQ